MKFIKLEYLVLMFLTVLCFHSCDTNKKEVVRADLSFRSISFASAYGATDDQFEKVMADIKSVVANYKLSDSVSYQNYLMSKRILQLDKLGLLRLPHIYLHFGADSIMGVYISEKEYEKIKGFKQVQLFKEKKKVVLELEVEERDSSIYYSDRIIKVKKVDGISQSNVFKRHN